MKCPHCLQAFFENWSDTSIGDDNFSWWSVRETKCPTCNRLVIHLGNRLKNEHWMGYKWRSVYPVGIARAPIPPEVDDPVILSDYSEACSVLTDSPKASAALSRRCLQHLLREKAGVTHSDLNTEIDDVINSNKLPSHLSENLDHVRVVGNFAAHPIKSKASGEIVDVEVGEAEWNLDLLEDLMDFYFVKPALAKKKKDGINAKLREAGKPELK